MPSGDSSKSCKLKSGFAGGDSYGQRQIGRKPAERGVEDIFYAGVWVASVPLHGTRKITKSGNMLKAEIGREQLGFASNNLSANFNACHRISIFLSSIPKSPQPPTPPRRKAVDKALRCFLILRIPGRVFPAYAGFQNGVRRERNWRKELY